MRVDEVHCERWESVDTEVDDASPNGALSPLDAAPDGVRRVVRRKVDVHRDETRQEDLAHRPECRVADRPTMGQLQHVVGARS